MTGESLAAEARGLRVIGRCPLEGHGDTMHVAFCDRYAYVGHMGRDRVGTSVVDVSDPRNLRLVRQIETPPGTHSHKTEVVGDLLLVNHERNTREPDATEWSAGLAVYALGADPADPRPIGFLPIAGGGVHRMTCLELPYVYMAASLDGYGQIFVVADLSDPTSPEIASTWWLPGMHRAGGETPSWPEGAEIVNHHVLLDGDIAYCAWWDAGVVALDVSDRSRPRFLWQWNPEEVTNAHTAMPIPSRGLLVVSEEAVKPARPGLHHDVWLLDVSDRLAPPRLLSRFPVPEGDGVALPGRFGPHNLHEVRPQAPTLVDESRVYVTWFAGGLRVFDISDPAAPREEAYCIPTPPPGQELIQLNDLAVRDDGIAFVTDRVGGGLYAIERV